jgi:superfamily II DNA or RNA helicase
MPPSAVYEVIDNDEYGRHGEALLWLASHFDGPLSVATAYVGLDGLDALIQAAESQQKTVKLLIGAAPSEGALTGALDPGAVRDRFRQSVDALRRERDFSGFPASRRVVLERVSAFVASEQAEVRRYAQRFLHGKTYALGTLNDDGSLTGPGAALVTSANLTHGGLSGNLELGMVHYQPNVVAMTLGWHRRLWEQAEDFRDDLLELLQPPPLDATPDDVFLRALIELYGDEPEPDRYADELTAFQRDGAARARRIMERYGGVLYADGVGMGKTEIAIDFIREHVEELGHHVLVIASAQLRDSIWQPRLLSSNLQAKVVSYQQLAQDDQLGGTESVLQLPVDAFKLVVVDEAHAYRNSDTSWYAALSKLMGGRDKQLAMLTATPVNNTLWDLHSLFLLFGRHDAAFAREPLYIPSLQEYFREAGADIDQRNQRNGSGGPSPARLFSLLEALTVRRDRAFIKEHYGSERFQDGTEVRFPEPELKEQRYSLDDAYRGLAREIGRRIGPKPDEQERPADALTMAQYRPGSYRYEPSSDVARQEALAGLMQSLLLKRLESSWYAALRTVRRMRQKALARIEYLRQTTDADFEIDDEDLAEIDGLTDDLLEEPGDWSDPEGFKPELLEDLQKDVEILGEIIDQIEQLEGAPDPKLDQLRHVMATTSAQKVAIFTSFQDTAEYLKQAIENDPGLLSGRTWAAVIGADASENERELAINRFCPELAEGMFDPEQHGGEIDVLLSTDVLSEGQNLQQAQVVLSYDMPWNPQRVVQRNGRVIRLRSHHDTVFLYTLMPQDDELEELLQLEAALQAKIRAANASMGMETPVLAGEASVQRIYEGMKDFTERLRSNDASLLDEDRGAGGAAFAGEHYRAIYRRAAKEGEVDRLKRMPWGIGAAIVRPDSRLDEPAVFFACRTREDRRYWRVVSASGEILLRDDLPMLQLIDQDRQQSVTIPEDFDLEGLFAIAADDICERHNEPAPSPNLPASQRWALSEILGAPDAPAGDEYNQAADVLAMPQTARVRRALSALRREHAEGGISVRECASRIVKLVEELRLSAVSPPPPPTPIQPDDIGVVCYQLVVPE